MTKKHPRGRHGYNIDQQRHAEDISGFDRSYVEKRVAENAARLATPGLVEVETAPDLLSLPPDYDLEVWISRVLEFIDGSDIPPAFGQIVGTTVGPGKLPGDDFQRLRQRFQEAVDAGDIAIVVVEKKDGRTRPGCIRGPAPLAEVTEPGAMKPAELIALNGLRRLPGKSRHYRLPPDFDEQATLDRIREAIQEMGPSSIYAIMRKVFGTSHLIAADTHRVASLMHVEADTGGLVVNVSQEGPKRKVVFDLPPAPSAEPDN